LKRCATAFAVGAVVDRVVRVQLGLVGSDSGVPFAL
jgi:hypothetical protein